MKIKPNLEAEQSVLGGLLLEPERLPEVMALLRPEHFLTPVNRALYEHMTRLFDRGTTLDFMTMLDSVKRRGIFAADDDAKAYLTQMAEVVPTTRNTLRYAELVADTARRSAAQSVAAELVDALEVEDMADCLDMAGQIQTALSHTIQQDTWSAEDAFFDYYISLKDRPNFIPTGFLEVDKRAYISPGDYVVVGGRPSSGKTALTLQMAAHMAKTRTVAYFSLETNRHKVMRRLVALHGGGSMQELLNRTHDPDKVYRASEGIKTLKLHIVEAAGWTVAQIKSKAIQLGAEVIFVDYMGLIKADGKGLYEKVTRISLDLRTMAQQTGVTVVALSQLSRPDKAKENPAPTMRDLRESGQIEQDADVILLLHRRNEEDDFRELHIAKNKEGEVGKLMFGFSGPGQRFYPEERRY